jgi:proline iminopeptidase
MFLDKYYCEMKKILVAILGLAIALSSACTKNQESMTLKDYFKAADQDPVQSGGVKLISVTTPKGNFNVWTKRFGNNPRIKVLLLHAGPALTHEYFESLESFLPAEGIEFIYYDQLGSAYSDQPKDNSLWNIDRFVDEIEQVRKALGLNQDNFYLLGHSWGAILAMEYTDKYQQNLKALILSNMMASVPDYNAYAKNVLEKQVDPNVLKEIKELEAKGDTKNPRYMELLVPNFYKKHSCTLKEWPEPLNRSFAHLNSEIYTYVQGPSELGASGILGNWDFKSKLKKINVPTLTVGSKNDTMDPEHMKWMSTQVRNGSFLYCPNGSHFVMWDDQQVYMNGLIRFIKSVDEGKKKIVF